jgi:hypothetical protein
MNGQPLQPELPHDIRNSFHLQQQSVDRQVLLPPRSEKNVQTGIISAVDSMTYLIEWIINQFQPMMTVE